MTSSRPEEALGSLERKKSHGEGCVDLALREGCSQTWAALRIKHPDPTLLAPPSPPAGICLIKPEAREKSAYIHCPGQRVREPREARVATWRDPWKLAGNGGKDHE